MSRIRAVLQGDDLTTAVRAALGQLVARLACGREEEIVEVILVGNTVMHHLFSGSTLSRFRMRRSSPHLGVQKFHPDELGWALPAPVPFVSHIVLGALSGSDILAGIVATGMTNSDDLMALVDLGTNGEIAIGNRDGIVCASTAAGPAFEAGSIRMGMRAATKADLVRRAWGRRVKATVIGDVEPRGICGSGLVDAVAAGLRSGAILAVRAHRQWD
jgi:uncharacterized 2Fe-2S/4Fe-4S cluster protein (DUF4445 family)